jgi:hypothetical protein
MSISKPQLLAPEDRAYLREVLSSSAGKKWIATLIAMRPAIIGKNNEERGLSASEALGYERAISNIGVLLEEPLASVEAKVVNIRED